MADEDEVLIRLPEIVVGVTVDGKHLVVQESTFYDVEAALRLAHGIEDTALAMKAGYKGGPVAEPSTD